MTGSRTCARLLFYYHEPPRSSWPPPPPSPPLGLVLAFTVSPTSPARSLLMPTPPPTALSTTCHLSRIPALFSSHCLLVWATTFNQHHDGSRSNLPFLAISPKCLSSPGGSPDLVHFCGLRERWEERGREREAAMKRFLKGVFHTCRSPGGWCQVMGSGL